MYKQIDELYKKLLDNPDSATRKKIIAETKFIIETNPLSALNNLSLEDMDDEFWLPVIGYEAKYFISSMGRIKSLCYGRGIILKQGTASGYLRVDLSVKTNHQLIHRLVGKAFIPNTENKPQINHKWGNTKDNIVSVLEWSTFSEQQLHAIQILGHIPKNPPKPIKGGNNPTAKPVNRVDIKSGVVLAKYSCIMDAERDTGIPNNRIVSAAKGVYHTAGGFKWEYA